MAPPFPSFADQLALSGILPRSHLHPRLRADQYRLSTLMPPRYSAHPEPGVFPDDGIVHRPQQMPEQLAESIDTWRRSVPSRMEREDPFDNDGFEERPSTRVAFHEPVRPVRRPSNRVALMRSAIPLFRRRDGPNALGESLMERPETALGVRDDDNDEPEAAQTRNPIRGFFALFGRKRKRRSPSVSPAPTVRLAAPLTLHFLFVGPPGSGQTSLLFRSRYGCFPDSSAITRTCYETYTNIRMYDSQPVRVEM
ncbi:hypothetical protein A9Z42_0069440 [Trichoderma parareesei]|uniref:Uncharacterized protein n=1 Tax=Trichoderma parareesei TaxID=858221 RepID=A0A2H2ZFD1_TRIPA|nr:hypothetical protein A9Z42_0069440 [Trichoderma parareesei]